MRSPTPEPFHTRGFRFSCAIVRLYTKLAKLNDVPPYLARQELTQGNQMTQQRLPWVTDTRHRSPDFKSEEFEV